MEQKLNSNSSSGATTDSSNSDEVTTSAKLLPNPMLVEVPGGLNDLAACIYQRNVEKGFYENPKNIGEMLCLIHSEVSEALEADRKNYYVEKRIVISEISGEQDDEQFLIWYRNLVKGKFEEEMADIFIRVLDMCAFKGIDIESHVKAKMRYNLQREKYHGKRY